MRDTKDSWMKLQPDVWIVPIRDGIEYMKNGSLTNDELINGDFEPFTCDPDPEPENCPGPSECQYTVDNEDIIGPIDYRLRICGLSCPKISHGWEIHLDSN